jgi:isopentenyl phosphate kinase
MVMFLKLGGSLITDKNKPRTLRPKILDRAVQEIKSAMGSNPDLKLVLGHGSGSFGHTPAYAYDTIHGVSSKAQWQGFGEVWKEARILNQYVMDCLFKYDIPSVCFPASAQIVTKNRRIISWNTSLIKKALDNHLVPVLYGDTVFDTRIQGTILSTEDQFYYLSRSLKPERILLAGIEEGVFSDFPINQKLLAEITLNDFRASQIHLGRSAATDVTGGMASKVSLMMDLLNQKRVKSVSIFSGLQSGNISSACSGGFPGTTLVINKRL